jgi:predicted secreted protein
MRQDIFKDKRSKKVVFLAHCIINQNAKSDGTSSYPGFIREIMELLHSTDYGIVQMPCPELHCLGLDRRDINGGSRPVIEENSRIRKVMSQKHSTEKCRQLVQTVMFQISEYIKNGFEVGGIIGINRSPSCGVDSTSKDNQEINGKGVFMEELQNELINRDFKINIIGIKVFEPQKAIIKIKELLALS